MTDDYKDFGENPGIALTTCTGCRAPLSLGADGALFCHNCGKPWAEAEAVALFPVQQPGVTAATNGVPFSKPPRIAPDEVRDLLTDCRGAVYAYWVLIDVDHPVNEVLTKLLSRIDAALAAASGDDGGTP